MFYKKLSYCEAYDYRIRKSSKYKYMKKLIYISIFLLISVFSFGENISREKASEFAKSFIEAKNMKSHANIASVHEVLYNGINTAYIFELHPRGFIITSASDKTEPLIGYSFNSGYVSPGQWPDQFTWLMDKAKQEIFEATNNEQLERNKAWDGQHTAPLKSGNVKAVKPMLKTIWDQGNKWNMFCPEDEDGPGGRAWVGCVAVSMAQIMYFHGYPEKGVGKKSYVHSTYGTQLVDFDKAGTIPWDSMKTSGADEFNAKLLYQCAVTVDMDFGPDGSGALTQTAAGALKIYFNYSQTTNHKYRFDNDEEWINKIIENLHNRQPIIYHGNGNDNEPGHAWVIDGIDEQGLFHNNWGWSGSMNGYFSIDNLAPGSNDFNFDQGAVLDIKPKTAGPFDILLTKTSVTEKQPAGTFISKVTIEDEIPDSSYSYQLKGNPIIFGDEGYAPAKFYIENDSLKTLEEFDVEKRDKYILFIEVSDTRGNSFEKQFDIAIEKAVSVNNITQQSLCKFYPNPAYNYLTIEKPEAAHISIYTQQGQLVKSFFSDNLSETINLQGLDNGVYFIKLNGKKLNTAKRFLKK